MLRRVIQATLVLFCVGFVFEKRVLADSGSRFVRILRDEKAEPQSLDTSIVTLVTGPESPLPSDVSVDLVAAVHIGEKAYYEQLNKRFESYDAVLFELIAPPGVDLRERETSNTNPVSALQLAMKRVLQLEFQLEAVNYAAPNFVHADMSPDQFMHSMKLKNESFGKMLMSAFFAAYKTQAGAAGAPLDVQSLFLLMFDDARAIALRRMMAGEFEQMDGLLEALNGEEGSTIISERNQVALKVLKAQIGIGKRRFAIFYGGAHMPDFEQRLTKMGMVSAAPPEWLQAWHLAVPVKR